jgi:hypothetical protein
VGHRIQGVLFQTRPDVLAIEAIAERYRFRLFELAGSAIWIADLAISGGPDRAAMRTARALAPTYVDAVRVLDGDEHDLEQLGWLNAAVSVARILGQTVLGFVSDDSRFDFAAIARPDGPAVIADHVAPYLLRWDDGILSIQPYFKSSDAGEPHPPEELSLIPAVALLAAEQLPEEGYPLHGNVSAEVYEFAPLAASVIGDGAVRRTSGALTMIESRGVESSCWD